MTPELHMTKTQEKRFYKKAVQASLETFYGKSRPEATKLVRAWWERLISTKAFASGIFLHAEPINTAANIADARVIAITEKNRNQYHSILNESRNLVLPRTTPVPAQAEKMQANKPDQPVHMASSTTASIRISAFRARVKAAKEKKAAQKQQVAHIA